jgi:uncharacterized protein YjiS (DUF1127 family)
MNELEQALQGRSSRSILLPVDDIRSVMAAARRAQSEMLAKLIAGAARAVGLAPVWTAVERSLVARLRRAHHRRRTLDMLSALSARELADIGLMPGEIEAAAAKAAALAVPVAPLRFAPVRRLRRAHRRHATIRELQRLPDHVLDDIGLARHEIEAKVDSIMAESDGVAPTTIKSRPTLHDVVEQVETAMRPLRRWQMSRLAAGQLARLDPDLLADIGYVKGDIDWVPEVMADRRLTRRATAETPRAA